MSEIRANETHPLGAALVSLILVGCGPAVIPPPADSWLLALPAEATACATNSDCVRIELDCCGCSNDSGIAGAVNRASFEQATERRYDLCGEDTICLDALSGHISCWGAEPACVDDTCVLVER